ncbi:MAG: hypothetical protein GEV11_22345, partial [Streptosporangiales bacterium]|nr:hypothetical protein [Streptosporangiales bacterium]
MVVLGLILVALAVGAAAGVLMDNTAPASLEVFSRPVPVPGGLTTAEVFLTGVVVCAVFMFGFMLIASGIRRSRMRRRELLDLRDEHDDTLESLRYEKVQLERQLMQARGAMGGVPGDPRGGDPRGGDPRGGDPRGGDPRGGDPRGGDPRGMDPFGGDPRGADPFPGDLRGGDMRGADMRGADPFAGDPRGGDPFAGDPRGGDPFAGDMRGGDMRDADPFAGDSRGGDFWGGPPHGGYEGPGGPG